MYLLCLVVSFYCVRERKEPAGTNDDQIYAAKKMYESAYHPETQNKMLLPGRMSFQVKSRTYVHVDMVGITVINVLSYFRYLAT